MNTITLHPVESSQIHAVGHDGNNTLAIQFKRKGEPADIYHYSNFLEEEYRKFMEAESIGSHFGKHIKPHAGKYPYKKMS